ncbi:hypothetical protein P3X46_022468 [Hevea brasiliensis]|uniref:Uncharacterized protein n=1 Tax=Hevea brasiliensis TaxID=3981 RepID=A0ABQ9L8Y9_HEVBR|nr:hypothetical protein P3X46_022468 [Hevea brasiliensis]
MAGIWFLALVLLSTLLLRTTTAKKTYIVHMNRNSKPHSYATHHDWYQSLTTTSDSILYTYTTSFHGFAAYLSRQEADSLSNMDVVLNVFEDRVYSVQTTRTPQFLGLDYNFGLIDDGREFQEIEQASQDVIVGVLDTGVWPESKSFDDTGLPEVAKRWKGKCDSTPDFDPRYFIEAHEKKEPGWKGIVSPRDYIGHGTHTASKVAGSPVANASMFGFAGIFTQRVGTARGIAVRARVASYKVCWRGCAGADILAGIERAILDGVDVLSLSIGSHKVEPAPYYRDPIAVGGFFAMQQGIFVSCSAGITGPNESSVGNVAPWIITVGASSIDRDFPAYVLLGNKRVFRRVSLYSGRRMGNKPVGLVYHQGKNSSSNLCLAGTLEPALSHGKVVICDRGTNNPSKKDVLVLKAGGVGMILVDRVAMKELVAVSPLVPTVGVAKKMGNLFKNYVKTDVNPTVVLGFRGMVVNVRPSPMVASFSSRGPNPLTQKILKPDIIAPGVNILAAWPEAVRTSMGCPHVSGIVALLKAAHPSWSPSAIKSALMTTAYTIDNTNPSTRDAKTKAFSPGLIYDIPNEEYTKFLCSLNYPLEIIRAMTQNPNLTCIKQFTDLGEFNYPSFWTHELTNVGVAESTYEVAVIAPSTVAVIVKPRKLFFKNAGEKLKYTVTFMARKNRKPTAEAAFGSISWRYGQYIVRSPVAFTWDMISQVDSSKKET